MISHQFYQKIKAYKKTKKLTTQLKYLEEVEKRKKNNKIGLIIIHWNSQRKMLIIIKYSNELTNTLLYI